MQSAAIFAVEQTGAEVTQKTFRRPWKVVEIGNAFVVEDADGTILARAEFAKEGCAGVAKWQARIIADRMVEAAEVLSFQTAREG